MIAPTSWLKDYVDIQVDAAELADKMVMIGNGVEGIEDLAQKYDGVVVGKILSLTKHPDADKLQVCQIDVGSETLQIVTGAYNVFEGANVPVATVGCHLPCGMSIKKGKLRGVESLGMLCSGEELNLKEEDYPGAEVYGIMIIQENVVPGTPFAQVLGVDDTIIEFEIGANRPDCLSILGLAREAGAALGQKVSQPDISFTESGDDIHNYVQVEVQDPDLCPRYIARAITDVVIEPSPAWMQKRLSAAGVRPINNIVDITNFVMLETGQPMHAFDLREITGGKIVVRRAQDGEKLVLLDGKEKEFTSSNLLICDAQKPIGVAGVMGGQDSGIHEDTATVIFEAAKFMYGNIRQTSRALGVATEASMRFSKGTDAVTTKMAMDRALHLVQQLGAGKIVCGEIDVLAEDLTPRVLRVDPNRVNGLIGKEIPVDTMITLLNQVGIQTQMEEGMLTCQIPSFRGDIEGSADIAEEVARMYGYDNIEAEVMTGEIIGGKLSSYDANVDKIRSLLTCEKYYECISYSFTSQAMMDKLGLGEDDPCRKAVEIINPLGDDKALLRTTLVPDMLSIVANNLNKKNTDFRLFEINKVFIPEKVPIQDLPTEYPMLCMAAVGKEEDFFTLKGTVEKLFDMLKVPGFKVKAGGAEYFHLGRKAQIFAKNGIAVGEMGEIHPDIMKNFGMKQRVYLAYICLTQLFQNIEENIVFTALPKYPAVNRDLAVIVDAAVPAGDVLDSIIAAGGNKLENARLFDVYEGEQLEAGKKSLAYEMTFRASDRTLTDEEVAHMMEKILARLTKDFQAVLR